MTNYYSDNNVHSKIMTMTGNGQSSVIPNIAVIHLGTQTRGENLAEIQSENARITQSIIQSMQRIGVSDIKTLQYSIDRAFSFEDGRQIDRGFDVRNILEIRTPNLDMAGTIIDAAVNSGANVIELISFDVSNRDYYYQQALNMAVMNAIQKAKSIAMSLGIRSEPIPVRIVENSNQFAPPLFRRELASTTPIVPGNINIEASVTVDFEF